MRAASISAVAAVIVIAIAIAIAVFGFNSSDMIKVKGHLVKDGQPYIIDEKEGLRIFFVPVSAPENTFDSFSALYDRDDGSFHVTGKDGKGMPPGEYRISLELRLNRSDRLNGEFSSKKSPLTCKIDSSHRDVVIDLEQKKAYFAGE
jgi:hypothetical protein